MNSEKLKEVSDSIYKTADSFLKFGIKYIEEHQGESTDELKDCMVLVEGLVNTLPKVRTQYGVKSLWVFLTIITQDLTDTMLSGIMALQHLQQTLSEAEDTIIFKNAPIV